MRKRAKTLKAFAPPDGGYGWVVLFASFSISIIADGVMFSFGLFHLEFLEFYQESKGKTALVGSILSGMHMLTGPLVSVLCDKFGYRAVTISGSLLASASFLLSTFSPSVDVLILLFGALAGAGFGLMYVPSIIIVGYYFEKKRAFAMGIAVSAAGVGPFVCAPLFNFLINEYDWRGATVITAGLVLNGAVMGALFRPPPQRTINEECQNDVYVIKLDRAVESVDNAVMNNDGHALQTCNLEERVKIGNADKPDEFIDVKRNVCRRFFDSMNLSLLKSPTFVVFSAAGFLFRMGVTIPYTFLPSYATGMEIDRTDASFLISIIGITGAVTRVACGFLSDRKFVDCILFNNIVVIIGGAGTILVPFCFNYELLTVACIVFAMSASVQYVLQPIILVELLGLETLRASYGMLLMWAGTAAFCGTPIAGMLYDATEVYDYSFYLAGGTMAAAGIICIPLRRLSQWEKGRRIAAM